MKSKIPIQNRIIALVLSMLFALGLFLSIFALPIEFTLFNPNSYTNIFEKEEYAEVLPQVLSEILVFQASASSQINEIDLIGSKDTIVAILSEKLPTKVVNDSYLTAVEQILAYLNFKIPLSDLKISSTDIKNALIADSGEIASAYLATFPNCLASEIARLDYDSDITANDLPQCKPSGNDLVSFEQIWTGRFRRHLQCTAVIYLCHQFFPHTKNFHRPDLL